MTTFNQVAETISYLQRSYQKDDFFYMLEAQKKAWLLDLGEVELVDMQGSYEDGPSDIWMVFRIIGEEDLYRIRGHYNSWDGDDWSSHAVERVTAYEKTITDYRVEERN